MAVPLSQILAKYSPVRRAQIDVMSKDLVAQVGALEALRKARELTQVDIASTLGVTQHTVSRLEHRAALLLSTLRRYVEAAGGELILAAKFPGNQQFDLTAFGEPLGFEDGIRIPDLEADTAVAKPKRVTRSVARGKARRTG